MALAEVQAELLSALQSAAPDAPTRPTRRGPVLTPMAVAVQLTAPQVYRLGTRAHFVHPIDCIITSEMGDVAVTEAQYTAVYDAATDFLEAVKETEPGGYKIYWVMGITVNIDASDDSAVVTATITIPVCERYPLG